MNVLFLGPLPEPVTGHSLACQVFFDDLAAYHHVEVINLNKSGFKQGISSVGRIFEVLGTVLQIWRKRNAAEVIYFTISESFAGNLKDLLIYVACFRRLSRMAIHLHGGAGMREIMLGTSHFRRQINEFFLKRLGAVIVLGQRHVEIFARAVPKERIHIVPNFAQDYLFADVDAITRKFRDVKPLRILFLSNLLPGKGHIELAEAITSLDKTAREAIEVDFAGGFESGEQEQAFRRRIAGLPRVHYHGTVHGEKKRQLFAAAHVFCLPTYYPYEGQPISILEAYASGCAVLTTDHSGVFDIFSNGVNGYEVACKSSQALKTAIEKAVARPQDLYAIALTNFATAQRCYRTSAHTRQLRDVMLRVHEQAADRGPRRSI